MDFVPEYDLTGKSTITTIVTHTVNLVQNNCKKEGARTHICHNLIRPRLQDIIVIPRPQLRERRQASRPHPILEVLVRRQVGNVGVVITRRIKSTPVWRRGEGCNVATRPGGVFLRLTRPGDTGLGEGVVGDSGRAVGRIDVGEVREGV